MVGRVQQRLVEVAPALAKPSRKLSELLQDAENALGAMESVAAVAVGRFETTVAQGAGVHGVVVLTDARLIVVTAVGQPWSVDLHDVVSIEPEFPLVRVETSSGPLVFSSPQAEPLVVKLSNRSVNVSLPLDRQISNRTLLSDPLRFRLGHCTVLGGSGPWALEVGDGVEVVFEQRSIRIDVVSGPQAVVPTTPFAALRAFEVSGRGQVISGGGFIGGGFGLTGAVEGMAVAAVLNLLTTEASVETILRIEVDAGEVFLAHTRWTPMHLRFALSEVFMELRHRQPPPPIEIPSLPNARS